MSKLIPKGSKLISKKQELISESQNLISKLPKLICKNLKLISTGFHLSGLDWISNTKKAWDTDLFDALDEKLSLIFVESGLQHHLATVQVATLEDFFLKSGHFPFLGFAHFSGRATALSKADVGGQVTAGAGKK